MLKKYRMEWGSWCKLIMGIPFQLTSMCKQALRVKVELLQTQPATVVDSDHEVWEGIPDISSKSGFMDSPTRVFFGNSSQFTSQKPDPQEKGRGGYSKWVRWRWWMEELMRKRGHDRTNQLEDKGEVVKREKTLKKRSEVSPTQLELTKIHFLHLVCTGVQTPTKAHQSGLGFLS